MCIVKTPKIRAGDEKPPEPIIIRNKYLDGVGPEAKALRRGRSSLRIERGRGGRSTAPSPTAPPIMTPAPTPTQPRSTPVRGGGGWGGGYGSLRITPSY